MTSKSRYNRFAPLSPEYQAEIEAKLKLAADALAKKLALQRRPPVRLNETAPPPPPSRGRGMRRGWTRGGRYCPAEDPSHAEPIRNLWADPPPAATPVAKVATTPVKSAEPAIEKLSIEGPAKEPETMTYREYMALVEERQLTVPNRKPAVTQPTRDPKSVLGLKPYQKPSAGLHAAAGKQKKSRLEASDEQIEEETKAKTVLGSYIDRVRVGRRPWRGGRGGGLTREAIGEGDSWGGSAWTARGRGRGRGRSGPRQKEQEETEKKAAAPFVMNESDFPGMN